MCTVSVHLFQLYEQVADDICSPRKLPEGMNEGQIGRSFNDVSFTNCIDVCLLGVTMVYHAECADGSV